MSAAFFAWVMRACGWEIIGGRPPADKYIFLCAPHTSNWDALWLFVGVRGLKMKPRVLIKSTLRVFPVKWFFDFLGGVPVDRSTKAFGLAQQMVEYAKTVDDLALVITPEGSRSHRKYWKSGFYQIALGANLPVYLVSVDYPSGIIKISEEPTPITGDHSADMDHIRNYYEGIRGKYPEEFGPIVLRSELKKERS